MADENTTDVLNALRKLAGFEAVSVESCSIQRLGGLTNLVYRVAFGGKSVIVRIPGLGTEAYIDRAVEIHNTRVAADVGIAAKVLWADPDNGVMISDCLDNIETMTPTLFHSREGSPARAGAALRKLHQGPLPVEFRFGVFTLDDR